MADQPIIIKKIKKGGHGHHGGAWKVAYADFVTAMMAFFLLLWLLNSVTQEQLEGISNYFAPVSIARTTSGAGGVLGGQAIGQAGALQGSGTPVVTMDLPQPRAGGGPQQSESEQEAEDIAEAAAEAQRKREQEQFEQAEQAIRQAIAQIPNLRDLAKGLMIDNTPEGLRIQIVDQEGLAMFPSGSPDMFQHTRRAIELVAQVIKQMPQNVSISGHTDAVPFAGGQRGYSNWELSADRANATRRALMDFGVPQERLSRVVGAAANDPLVADDPKNPRNRRIAIVLLREQPMAETPPKTN